MKTGFISMRIAIPCYLIPFAFAYAPELILVGSLSKIAIVVFTTTVGVRALAAANEGWFLRRVGIVERIILSLAAISLIIPEFYTDLLGLFLLGIVIFTQKKGLRLSLFRKKEEVPL
jgi:TRAP-type uncharacterized transport system fused permease subunit